MTNILRSLAALSRADRAVLPGVKRRTTLVAWLLLLCGGAITIAATLTAWHMLLADAEGAFKADAQELSRRGEVVLAVDTDLTKLEGLPCATLQGSAEYPSVLEEANLREAKLLVSALNIEDANILLLERAQRAGVPASIHAFHTGAVEELEGLGADHLIVGKDESVRRMAEELRRAGVLA